MMNGGCLADRTNLSEPKKDLLNPFVHHLELTTTYEKIKAGILTVVVLPVRLAIIAGLLILAWLLACIGLFGLSEKDLQERPISPWRRVLRSMCASTMRFMLFWWGFHWLRVKGSKASRFRAPLLVLAPHSSFFDILPIIYMKDVTIISKAENLKLPFIGKLINFTQPVYVWRDDPHSRQKTIQQIIDRATSPLDWSQMLIFPEGTCTNRSCLITFKPGAFYPGVPVQPVILRYPNKLDTVTWTWQGPGALKLMWLTLVQPHSNCEIEFLPVYKPSEAERRDPKLYAENVRQLMARALGVPTVEYTYDDCQLVAKASELQIPRSSSVLRIVKSRIRLGLTRNQKEEKLVSDDPDLLKGDERVDCSTFAERLGVSPTDPALKDLFALLSPDDKNQVDFAEYLLAVLMVERSTTQSEMISLAFELCGDDFRLSRHKVALILKLVLQMEDVEATKLSLQIPADEDGCISEEQFELFMDSRPELLQRNTEDNRHNKND
ncbi:lysophosphatidylcholine acyltransferase 1-like isoform X1 [Macrosteles quadrilineatus]|uniref:lysophosphatidylcholine acyltransferase 1-like isoform X1 n=1 Tax=Macrosteles quadrilineatus TaxID=74068 RepID=UPI0023E2B84F|nr:lysophosphatidylcholine acyltransferase 1-like isoform X1 [Macrosteles quadrilineatus]